MGDFCHSRTVEVSVQENGIVRDASGRIIARLVSGVDFADMPTLKSQLRTLRIKNNYLKRQLARQRRQIRELRAAIDDARSSNDP